MYIMHIIAIDAIKTLNSPGFAWHPYGKTGLFKVV